MLFTVFYYRQHVTLIALYEINMMASLYVSVACLEESPHVHVIPSLYVHMGTLWAYPR